MAAPPAPLHKVVLTLKDDGSPEFPGLLRVPRGVEFAVRVPPNRRMYQVRSPAFPSLLCARAAPAGAVRIFVCVYAH